MIYDCFLFYKELDLLELRLHILNDHVDRFVLMESNKSFTGRPKPLFFEENKDRFAPFLHKIIHLPVLDDPPDCSDAWTREKHQRNAIARGLKECSPEDCIILSDLDEIPNPQLLDNLPSLERPLRCRQLCFFYQFNNLNVDKPLWSGSRIFRYDYLETNSLQSLRKLPKSMCRIVERGGWHFSFLGDIDFITDKLNDFSHQEYNTPQLNNPETIKAAIASGLDVRGREYRYTPVKVDTFFPEYLRTHLDRYAALIGSFENQSQLPSAGSFISRGRLSSSVNKIMRRLLKRDTHPNF